MGELYFQDTGAALKLFQEDELIGSISHEVKNDDYEFMYLHCVGIKPEFRGKGYYKILVEALEKKAKGNNCRSVRFTTGIGEEHNRIRDISRKNGFLYLPQTNSENERGRIRMEKILS